MPDQIGQLITNKSLAKQLGICTRTIFRWAEDPSFNFPKPLKIGFRRYFMVSEVEAWIASRRPSAPMPPPSDPQKPAIVEPIPCRKAGHSLIDRAHASEVAEAR